MNNLNQPQFFAQLWKLMTEDVDLILKVSKSAEELVISVQPKSVNKDSKNDIPAITVKGTAQDFDEGFIETLGKPLAKTQGIVTNLEWHDKMIESIAEKKRKELEEKAKAKKKKANSTSQTSSPSATVVEAKTSDDAQTLFTVS